MLKSLLLSPVVTVLFAGLIYAGSVSDEEIGYTAYLPDGWIKTAVNATQHRFEDTSGVYQSMVVINRYDFSGEAVYETSEDWTRANFIAYIFSIEADPVCALTFYDSVTVLQNESLRAMDAFSQFFSIDTILGDWAEYIRFTATGTYGYEIYAIGPADDMLTNVGMYVAIIEEITLKEEVVSIVQDRVPQSSAIVRTYGPTAKTFDILGRTMVAGNSIRSGRFLVTRSAGTTGARTRVVIR